MMCNAYRLVTDAATPLRRLFSDPNQNPLLGGHTQYRGRADGHQDHRFPRPSSVGSTVNQGPAILCKGAGAGPDRTASRSIISVRTGANSPRVAASFQPTAFYEFTEPADTKKKRKDKWLFTKDWRAVVFASPDLWRADKQVGEAFTMLTMPPGPDIAPYHDRQIAILDRADWAAWLDASTSAKAILKPLTEGSLGVEQVG